MIEQRKKIQDQDRIINDQNRLITEQTTKLDNFEGKLAEINRKLLEYDQRLVDTLTEVSPPSSVSPSAGMTSSHSQVGLSTFTTNKFQYFQIGAPWHRI